VAVPVIGWLGSLVVRALDLQLEWLRVQFPVAALWSNNLRQVIHTHLPLQVAMVQW